MTNRLAFDALPFDVTPSHPVWIVESSGAVVVTALAHTDFYVDPGSADTGTDVVLANAATLLGTPPMGDFQFSARVSVEFAAQYDAGALMIWVDGRTWAKLCFEFSPDAEPMVVSVVTCGVSDDANSFVVPDRSIWMRMSRLGAAYAFHASTDGMVWRLIRVFTLGEQIGDHRIGLEAQSPTGDGCIVTFDDVRFASARLSDLRDGS